MTTSASSGAGPVTIIAIGAGNRTNKYLEYAVRHPERLKLVGVVELNPIRRKAVAEKFGLDASQCFENYDLFFQKPVPADSNGFTGSTNVWYMRMFQKIVC